MRPDNGVSVAARCDRTIWHPPPHPPALDRVRQTFILVRVVTSAGFVHVRALLDTNVVHFPLFSDTPLRVFCKMLCECEAPTFVEVLFFQTVRNTPKSSPKYNTEHVPLVSAIMKPGIERVQALADISRSALYCPSNETRAPIANPPNSAQLEGTPTVSPTYIRVRAVMWVCGEGQTHRHTDGRDQYTFRRGYASREM